jgi:hypothetical protein
MIDWTRPIETMDRRRVNWVADLVEVGTVIYVYPVSPDNHGDSFIVNHEGFRVDDRALYSARQEPFIRNVKDTEAELREMMRDPRYWRTREPEFVKRVMEGFLALVGGDMPPADAPAPETKTLRDEFAGYAIIGLLAAGDCHAFNRDEMAVEAYRQADAMMEARKK